MAISSRRNPFVRRDRPSGRPTSVGASASRRARRNAASSSRRVTGPFDHAVGGLVVVVALPVCGAAPPVIGNNEHMLSLDAMLSDLEYLVSVESPSHDIEAITRSATAVRDVISRRLGREAELIDSAAGPHVHARFGSSSRVLLVSHHDTVFP